MRLDFCSDLQSCFGYCFRWSEYADDHSGGGFFPRGRTVRGLALVTRLGGGELVSSAQCARIV